MLSKLALSTAAFTAVAASGFGFQDRDGFSQVGAGYAAPPAETYGAPAETYGAPPAYAGPASLDLTPVIIGVLILTGLSLLFPTFVSLTGRRRKRSASGKRAATL